MGEAICRLFAKEGAKVVVADYNFEGAEKVASEINTQTPDAATAIKTDVSIETDINAMIDTAITFFGKVDILINNAGIMDGFEPVGEVTNARWDRVFAVNVNGPMYASRKAIQYFLEQGHGNIINIASIGGLQGGRAGACGLYRFQTCYHRTDQKHGLHVREKRYPLQRNRPRSCRHQYRPVNGQHQHIWPRNNRRRHGH